MEDQTPELDLLYGLVTNNDQKIGEFTLHLEVTRGKTYKIWNGLPRQEKKLAII